PTSSHIFKKSIQSSSVWQFIAISLFKNNSKSIFSLFNVLTIYPPYLLKWYIFICIKFFKTWLFCFLFSIRISSTFLELYSINLYFSEASFLSIFFVLVNIQFTFYHYLFTFCYVLA